MANITDAYLATMARRTGVPELWIEDCVAEMRARDYLHPGQHREQIAIDYARRFGRYSRGGVWRNVETLDDPNHPIAISAPDFTAVADQALDLARAWPRLTPGQRLSISNLVMGRPKVGAGYNLACVGRKRLRELCA